ncbi:MAG: hypothetical protein ACU0DW_11885 [Shimia sp.]
MRVVLCLLFVFLPVVAGAGAWPREDGSVFTSTSVSVDRFGSGTSFYAEYGLRSDTTLVGSSWFDDNRLAGTLAFAVRWHPEQTWRDWRFGLTAGIGADYDLDHLTTNVRPRAIGEDQGPWLFPAFSTDARLRQPFLDTRIDPFLRLGAHTGRGTEWGWMSGDIIVDLGEEASRAILSTTVGWRVTDAWTLTGQTFTTIHTVSDPDVVASLKAARGFEFGAVEGGLRIGLMSGEPSAFVGVSRSF